MTMPRDIETPRQGHKEVPALNGVQCPVFIPFLPCFHAKRTLSNCFQYVDYSEYFSLLGGTYHGSCILQGYVDEKRLKPPALGAPYSNAWRWRKTSARCRQCE